MGAQPSIVEPPATSAKLPPASSIAIFVVIGAGLVALLALQQRVGKGNWLPPPGEKREYEQWVLRYSVVWMGSFGVIIAGKLYESFDAFAYFCVCGGLAWVSQ